MLLTLLLLHRRETVVDCRSCSASVVPVALPFAPLLGVLLFWLPFLDHGANAEHITELKGIVEVGLHCMVSETVVHPGAKLGLKVLAGT